MDETLERALGLLADKSRILVFTGAGISTESGIPDFRGPQGVWTKVDPAEFTFQRYLRDPETRRKRWRMALDSPMREARPNRAHRAVVDLWKAGRLEGCVTQNIDGLHQQAGLPDDQVVEVHGNARTVRCLECEASWATEEVLSWVEAGDSDPSCPHCGGLIKTATISFGQLLPEEALRRAQEMSERCDAVVTVGSTLSVYPAAWIPLEAAGRGVPFVIVNRGPTEHDHAAAVHLEGSAGELLPRLVGALLGSGK